MSSVAVPSVARPRDAHGHFLPMAPVAVAPKVSKPKVVVANAPAEKAKVIAKPKVSKPKVVAEGRRAYTTVWDKAKNVMTCTKCNATWTPKFREGGKRLVRGSWICPKGCCKK